MESLRSSWRAGWLNSLGVPQQIADEAHGVEKAEHEGEFRRWTGEGGAARRYGRS